MSGAQRDRENSVWGLSCPNNETREREREESLHIHVSHFNHGRKVHLCTGIIVSTALKALTRTRLEGQ